MPIKDGLLLVVAEARAKEAAELVPLCDDSPRPPDRWTARDNLAHLTAWREHATRVLAAARTGAALPPASDDLDEQNAENAALHQATLDLPASAVAAGVERSWEALTAAIEACSEADLRRPHPGRPGRQIWEVVPGNAHGHLAEHLGYWYTEHHDEAAAEAAAWWVHDLDGRAFRDPRSRANAAYNLGCFYARRSRAGDALPHLRRALELNPALRDWAAKDADLDPIRTQPEVAALLG